MGAKFQEATSKLLDIMHRAWLKKHGVPLPAPIMTAQQRAEIQECFEMLDRDGSGALDVREIIHAFGALGFTISKDAISDLMSEADPDGSGELEFDEFLSLMGRALYQPDERGMALVAKTGSGDLSFADVVRAFRRKKLIESLIQGGDARLKVVEFHEKVQDLMRAETDDLRQRQNTQAPFARTDNDKVERERLQRVLTRIPSKSPRPQKLKARLQDAIDRSLGAFDSLYRRHKSVDLDASTAAATSAQPQQQDRQQDRQHRRSAEGSSRTSSPPAGTRGVTFMTELRSDVSPNPTPMASNGWDRRPRVPSEFSRPPSRSLSTSVLDKAKCRRVSTNVLQYFKQLDEQTKKMEKKFDDSARFNAALVHPPPDRSAYSQVFNQSSHSPMSRYQQLLRGCSVTSLSACLTNTGDAVAPSALAHIHTSPASCAGSAERSPPGSSLGASSHEDGDSSCSDELGSGSCGLPDAVADATEPAYPTPATASGSSACSGGGSGGEVGRARADGTSRHSPLRAPRSASARVWSGPSTAAWAEFVAAASALSAGGNVVGGVSSGPAAASVAMALHSSGGGTVLPNTTVMASRAWRHAPSFGPGGSVVAARGGWGAGVGAGVGTSQSQGGGGSGGGGGSNSAVSGHVLHHSRTLGPGSSPATGSMIGGNDPWVSASSPGIVSSRVRSSKPTTVPLPPVRPGSASSATAAQDVAPLTSVSCSASSPLGQQSLLGRSAYHGAGSASVLSVTTWVNQAATAGEAAERPQSGCSGESLRSGASDGQGQGALASRSAMLGPGVSSAAVSGGAPCQTQQVPGPLTRAWLAKARSINMGSVGGNGGGMQRSFRLVGPEAERRHMATSATGMVPGQGVLTTAASGVAATASIPAAIAASGGGRVNSYSHGPFRAASRGPAGMGSAVGAVAEALVEGIVSVTPAPGTLPPPGFVIPTLPSRRPGSICDGVGCGGDGKPPSRCSRPASRLQHHQEHDAAGTSIIGGPFRHVTGASGNGDLALEGPPADASALLATLPNENRAGSRSSTMDGHGGWGGGGARKHKLASSFTTTVTGVAAHITGGAAGAGGAAPDTVSSATGASAAAVADAAAAAPDETVDMEAVEGDATTALRCDVIVPAAATLAAAVEVPPLAPLPLVTSTSTSVPHLESTPAATVPAAAAAAATTSAGNGGGGTFVVAPISLALKLDGRDNKLSIAPRVNAPRSPRQQQLLKSIPSGDSDIPVTTSVAEMEMEVEMEASPDLVTAPPAAPPKLPSPSTNTIEFLVSERSAITIVGAAPSTPPPPVPISAMPTPSPLRSAASRSSTPAAAATAVTHPTPQSFAPRGAYKSLQVGSQQIGRDKTNRSPRINAVAAEASGYSSADCSPLPSARTPVMPPHDRVVVTCFGQPLSRARNGAIILHTMGSPPQSCPSDVQQQTGMAMAANGSAAPSQQRLLSAHTRPWPGSGSSAMATTSAAASAWLNTAAAAPTPSSPSSHPPPAGVAGQLPTTGRVHASRSKMSSAPVPRALDGSDSPAFDHLPLAAWPTSPPPPPLL